MAELFTNDMDLTKKLTALEERVEQLATVLEGLEFLVQENKELKKTRFFGFAIPESWIKEDTKKILEED